MSRLRIITYLFLFLSGLGIVGCETEIDIIAPKRDVTVIYGILEPNKSRHFIRINRAFIGEDSASVLAAQQGVTEYQDEEMEAFIEEFNPTTNAISKTWKLASTYVTSKEDGAFFSDSNKVYYWEQEAQ